MMGMAVPVTVICGSWTLSQPPAGERCPLALPSFQECFFDAAKRVLCIETGEIFKIQAEVRNTILRRDHANMANADRIGKACRGQRKSAGGFTWVFVPAPASLPTSNGYYRGGEPITSVDKAFRAAQGQIGRSNVRFHDLRHTIASWLTRGGTPLTIVQANLATRR